MKKSIYIGFDSREIAAYIVAVSSIKQCFDLGERIPIYALELNQLIKARLYTRPIERREGLLYDPISEHPMSTEFAISRFLTPYLAQNGWALFADCDVLARYDLNHLFNQADPKYAVMVVKHNHRPTTLTKMDNQLQSSYSRKNWSSVCLWNCDHPANKALTLDYINSVPGRVLHGYSWLRDEEIGELPVEYNWLVGSSSPTVEPKIAHFTEGTPHMRGYENCAYADEWRNELTKALSNSYWQNLFRVF